MLSDADWYLIRATGVVTLLLLTAVMVLGIATANRGRLNGLPRFVTANVHRNISLLSVVFLAVHIVTSLLDPYAAVSLLAVVVPGARAAHALWISLGALSLDVIVALIVTSLLRTRFGYRSWRATHWLAYASWPLAFAHSVGMGTDASSLWCEIVAYACLGAVVVASGYRVAQHRPGKRMQPQVMA